jgi:hypothetical protein
MKVSASYVRVEGSPPLGEPNEEVYATWLDLTPRDLNRSAEDSHSEVLL